MGMHTIPEVGVPVLVPMPIEGFRRQNGICDWRHFPMPLEVTIDSSQNCVESPRHTADGVGCSIRRMDRFPAHRGQQDRLRHVIPLVISEKLQQSDYELEVGVGDAALLVEPITVVRSVRLFKFVGNPVTYEMLSVPRHSGNQVQPKISHKGNGDTSCTQLDLVHVIGVPAQSLVQCVQVIGWLPTTDWIHDDLDVGVVAVGFDHRLDQRVQTV